MSVSLLSWSRINVCCKIFAVVGTLMCICGYYELKAAQDDLRTTRLVSGRNTSQHGSSKSLRYFSYDSEFSLTPELDTNSSDVFLVYVLSTAADVDKRALVRKTWGNLRAAAKSPAHSFTLQLMFVVGSLQVEPPQLRKAVIQEHSQHGDLLSVNTVTASASQDTEKSLYALTYISRELDLSKLDYVLRVDGDTFVNLFSYLHLAADFLTRPGDSGADLVCEKLPEREFVEQGADQMTVYRYDVSGVPDHCSGPVYMASRRAVRGLVRVSGDVPVMADEGLMLTGLGLQDAGLTTLDLEDSERVDGAQAAYWLLQSKGEEWVMAAVQEMFYLHEYPKGRWWDTQKVLERRFLESSV